MLKDSFSKKGEEKNKRADELAKEVKITKLTQLVLRR